MSTLPREFALSRANGWATAPKDLAYAATSVPCQAACPAGTDIPGYLEAIARGDAEEAYRINLRDNVFPAVLGRVCTRPCEPVCRHGVEGNGEPVAICWAKRSAEAFAEEAGPVVLDPVFLPSGKSVAVIGGGVSGLTVARELALWGHDVVVFEQHGEAGGMMIQGIPEFRLPREPVRREVEQIAKLGVEIRCGVKVGAGERGEGNPTLEGLVAEHDGVVIAAGTFRPNVPDIPGVDLSGVSHGIEFLTKVNAGEEPPVGRRVVVIGGGFTAVDCVRIGRRLGAEEVTMAYRRDLAATYIPEAEFASFPAEGIAVEFLAAPVAIEGRDGAVTGVRFVRTELVDGKPVPVEGTEFVLPADTVLLGTGQAPNVDWLGGDLGEVGESVFLAGDFKTGPSSLIDSIGDGKTCARTVDRFLMGEDRFEEGVMIQDRDAEAGTGRSREMDLLPRQKQGERPLAKRGLRDEVELGLDAGTSRVESSRCYLCNFKYEIDNDMCIYCDRCLKVMPVADCIVKAQSLIFDEHNAVVGHVASTSPRDYNLLWIDPDKCIRCGACVEVCPVECIPVQKLTRATRQVPGATGTL